MLLISAVKLDLSTDAGYLEEWQSHISEEKRSKLSSISSREERLRTVASEVLARTKLCAKLSVHNENLHFEKGMFGKPFVASHPLHFNVSYAEEWAVCAVSDHPVGIDVELVAPVTEPIIALACSLRERAWLDLLPDSERPHHFYRLWSLKQAFVKNLGCGFAIPPDVLSFHVTPSGKPLLLFPGGYKMMDWTFEWGDWDDRHKWAVCCSDKVKPVMEKIYTCAELHLEFAKTWNKTSPV